VLIRKCQSRGSLLLVRGCRLIGGRALKQIVTNSALVSDVKISPLSTVHKKECNEKHVNNCYQQYNQNATSICPEVKKLRICISELTGCHAMKHPKFVLSIDILEKHRECFFVNYSRILEVLKKKG